MATYNHETKQWINDDGSVAESQPESGWFLDADEIGDEA